MLFAIVFHFNVNAYLNFKILLTFLCISHILLCSYISLQTQVMQRSEKKADHDLFSHRCPETKIHIPAQGLMYETVCNHSACLTLFPIWLEEAASESYNNSPGLQTVDTQCVFVGREDRNTSRLPHVQRCDSSFPQSRNTRWTFSGFPVDLLIMHALNFWEYFVSGGKGTTGWSGLQIKMKINIQIVVRILYNRYKLHESE